MKLQERIEQIAREAVERTHKGIYVNPEVFQIEVAMCHSAIIAILTDPAVGFKEALEYISGGRTSKSYDDVDEMFRDLESNDDTKYIACIFCTPEHHNLDTNEAVDNPSCPCPCHTAQAKLKELESL